MLSLSVNDNFVFDVCTNDVRITDLGHLYGLKVILFWTVVQVLFFFKKTR